MTRYAKVLKLNTPSPKEGPFQIENLYLAASIPHERHGSKNAEEFKSILKTESLISSSSHQAIPQ